jgi:hypothetical protein
MTSQRLRFMQHPISVLTFIKSFPQLLSLGTIKNDAMQLGGGGVSPFMTLGANPTTLFTP